MDRKETEKRRRELLSQTRHLYHDKDSLPAVHPRYQSAYQSLYEDPEKEEAQGSFGIRLLLCCLLFIGFVLMDENNLTIAQVDSQMIITSVEEGIDVQETFQELTSYLEPEAEE